ncbi:MAG: DUF4390 domain-containing protein [Betaproteobacteria bacterium]|nr:DUF4390 domain-containing protein [Betaproteobacteria bacterium]
MPALPRRKFLVAVLGLALAAAAAPMRAEGIHAKRIDLQPREEHYVLVGGFEVQLNDKLEEALKRGVTITFIQEFELERPRDYWLAEGVADATRTLKLSYNALLRSFVLNTAGRLANYDSLPEALAGVGSLNDWAVAERHQIKKKATYRASVRLRVDPSQLPKPLQVSAFASDRWQMDSDWIRWSVKF